MPSQQQVRVSLTRSAFRSARARDHVMGRVRWRIDSGGQCSYGMAKCKCCGKEVYLCSRPAPNEIAISGEAVALGCRNA